MVGRSPGRIFISYRRQETAWPARQMYDVLVQRFGPDEVFKDVDNIEPGEDFIERITSAVASCRVLIAMVGPHWTTLTDAAGRRRLDDPDDFVRLEIRTALERDVVVVPVLVDGATMPAAADVPADLAPLTRRQAVEVSAVNFDTDRLLAALTNALETRVMRIVPDPPRPAGPDPVRNDPVRNDPAQPDGAQVTMVDRTWRTVLVAMVAVAAVVLGVVLVRPWSQSGGPGGGAPTSAPSSGPSKGSTTAPVTGTASGGTGTGSPSGPTSQDGGPTGPRVLAHRGGFERHQLETVQALEAAARFGAAVETDVRWTKDGVAVLVHDEAGTEGLQCAGGDQLAISRHTLAELAVCRSKRTRADPDTYPIPQYRPAMEAVAAADPDAWVYVELKVDRTDAGVRQFLGVLHEAGLADHAVVTSTDVTRLERVHRLEPTMRTMLFVTSPTPVELLQGKHLWGIAVEQGALAAPYVAELHGAGLVVVAWTVNDETAWARAVAAGADKLLTDYPERCTAWLATHS